MVSVELKPTPRSWPNGPIERVRSPCNRAGRLDVGFRTPGDEFAPACPIGTLHLQEFLYVEGSDGYEVRSADHFGEVIKEPPHG